ncbi:AMP-binding protein [Pseudomonas chlororaphis]|uniref:AMP-dependent synthetase n=1 Tax=Pseudomonas chlororaphis TaxID=587753 RepID=A0A1Q8EQH4_9PSED|nr:AMP-binding protein [Pseudomonas chlororaphis]OLF54048.1 AMP-dependent synthetase [Pseudomonas chlororaphis]
MIKDASVSIVRILALHGRGSNGDVTRIQLKNLGLNESEYEVVYANGPLPVDAPGPGMDDLQALIPGPWYSWLPCADAMTGEALADALCDAVLHVLAIIENQGPFDGVFGFSQGGVVASLVNGLPGDEALMAALQKRAGRFVALPSQNGAIFRAALMACAGAGLPLAELRSRAGLGPVPLSSSRSIHLIGREDAYKPWSESLALALDSTQAEVFYLAGGHAINPLPRDHTELGDLLRRCLGRSGNEPDLALPGLEWQPSSARSSRAVARDVQVAAVKLDTQGLPQTIVEMLAAQPADAPLLRLARERDARVATTYGQMLAFCQPGGDGDLRRLGVQAGEVVAYLAPPGGSAAAAVAFLSIAAQTCAVPFGATMSEADARSALAQYGVKHMVLFEDVSAPGVRTAFEGYARSGQARLHHACQRGTEAPGLFRYGPAMAGFQDRPALVNPPTAHCLLLRTSGSTSVPKVVPLRQRDLVWNAAILADGIGIDARDVTYSVMPLDHIGGLSASILCSVAVGASITCEGLYNPQGMVEALMHSNPQPTWYSAVPTIHNATARYLQDDASTCLDPQGRWPGHRLRVIRSGAAALKEADRLALERIYGCEVVATYSMSEQMPISQPPRHPTAGARQPGAVGVPVTASLAVVDPVTLRPLPFGTAGEIAISGPSVFTGYLDNPTADRQSRFLLQSPEDGRLHTWFLTGDLGEIDADGTLCLRGRLKELIKRGGEQISPFEVENALTQHPWVNTAVCFPVPSDLYGEEVGCALVLEPAIVGQASESEVAREMRAFLRQQGLAPYKYPAFLKQVADEELPKTPSRKYLRNGLAQVLGLAPRLADSPVEPATVAVSRQPPTVLAEPAQAGPKVDWSTLAGFRFLLACYVMFMHIGSEQSWAAFANLRQFPWHVHAFFVVAGFSLAVFMPALITRKAAFFWARVSAMYPLYAVALLFALINLLPHCQPSTFSAFFHWNAQPGDADRWFCEGTPLLPDSWLANLLSTVAVYLAGLSATPLWGASWFMGFYLWFISMYFQCLVVFPVLYNALYKSRGNTRRLLWLTAAGLVLNVLILLGFWYGYAADATGHGFFDLLTGEWLAPDAARMAAADRDNAVMLGFYLFAPFWMVYFVLGMCVAFLYDAIRPAEQGRAYRWGYVADAITLLVIAFSAAHVLQGYIPHGAAVAQDTFFLRPSAADSVADPGIVHRIWDEINSRLFAPITLLWVFALSTGQGLTARILRLNPISQTLAPTAYACFLFHQVVGQWYYAATRHGEWWNWWSYRKDFYWFSPQPVPVEWYEYFYVVGLVVIFAKLVQPLEQLARRGFALALGALQKAKPVAALPEDTLGAILQIVQRSTGLEARAEWSLEECGLASLGVVQFTNTLRAQFSTSGCMLVLSVAKIMSAGDIREIAAIVEAARDEARQPQDRALQMT